MFGPAGEGAHFAAPHPEDDDRDDLRPKARVERHRLVFAVATTLAALPLLVIDNISASAQGEDTVVAAADGPSVDRPITLRLEGDVIEVTTTTTAAPTTTTTAAPTTTTAAPAPVEIAAAQAPAPTTTTTVAPTTTTTRPPSTQSGDATWYAQPASYHANGCAHRTLPFGTVVTVTNRANGASATCTVNDRGPYSGGRIIDLDDDVFERLAPLSSGVISVSISW